MNMRWKLEQILKKGGGSVLFEDEAIIAINKPCGLLVLPDRFNMELPNLYTLLKETFGAIYVVHRIDKETSGVVLFAKTTEAHRLLCTAFENRSIEKKYRVIVVGTPKTGSGIIDLPVVQNIHGLKKVKIDQKRGKDARTEYKVIEYFNGYAYIEARPRTGRMHQIRIHLSAIGLPILGDSLYGEGGGFFLSSIKHNYRGKETEQPLLSRTALHAYSICILHPLHGVEKVIEAPLPKDMESVLKALRKYQRQ
jgi:23S rRNA pseudouridine1911/1915/1917 synthase